MKYNKIITITLANGLVLLLFASLLASCQKKGIQSTGHFTNYKILSRMPASIDPLQDYFDPKQIYLYCRINSINIKQCFKQHFSEKLIKLKKENKISKNNIKSYNYEEYLNNAQINVAKISTAILKELDSKIYRYVKKKEELCNDNTVIYLRKCLNNSIESDSMHILNTYQEKSPDINGHEYLYLKNIIITSLTNKLRDSLKKIKNLQKKNIIKVFDDGYSKYRRMLINDKNWLANVVSLPNAINKCTNLLNDEIKREKKLNTINVNTKEVIKEYFCNDFINSPEIIKIVNYNYNIEFEKRLLSFYDVIQDDGPMLIEKCINEDFQTKDIIDDCIEKNWNNIVQYSYNKWNQQNSKENNKEIIIQRTQNNSPKLKRAIASKVLK